MITLFVLLIFEVTQWIKNHMEIKNGKEEGICFAC